MKIFSIFVNTESVKLKVDSVETDVAQEHLRKWR